VRVRHRHTLDRGNDRVKAQKANGPFRDPSVCKALSSPNPDFI